MALVLHQPFYPTNALSIDIPTVKGNSYAGALKHLIAKHDAVFVYEHLSLTRRTIDRFVEVTGGGSTGSRFIELDLFEAPVSLKDEEKWLSAVKGQEIICGGGYLFGEEPKLQGGLAETVKRLRALGHKCTIDMNAVYRV